MAVSQGDRVWRTLWGVSAGVGVTNTVERIIDGHALRAVIAALLVVWCLYVSAREAQP